MQPSRASTPFDAKLGDAEFAGVVMPAPNSRGGNAGVEKETAQCSGGQRKSGNRGTIMQGWKTKRGSGNRGRRKIMESEHFNYVAECIERK